MIVVVLLSRKIVSLIRYKTDDNKDEIKNLSKNLCMHVAAMKPESIDISVENIPAICFIKLTIYYSLSSLLRISFKTLGLALPLISFII